VQPLNFGMQKNHTQKDRLSCNQQHQFPACLYFPAICCNGKKNKRLQYIFKSNHYLHFSSDRFIPLYS